MSKINYYPRFALLLLFISSLLSWGCQDREKREPANDLVGTWELLSETKIEKGDTVFTPAAGNQRMLKIINPTHFSFIRHDLKAGKDSFALFVAGAGPYTLTGNIYKEQLEFCSAREWENHDFEFTVEVKGDTLIQQGVEKVEGTDINRFIIEQYKKVRK